MAPCRPGDRRNHRRSVAPRLGAGPPRSPLDPHRTLTFEQAQEPGEGAGHAPVGSLVLLWSRDEPDRAGEEALLPGARPGAAALLGRAGLTPGEPVPHLEWVRKRPGQAEPTGPLRTPYLSREQLRFETGTDGGLQVDNLGRARLLLDGRPVDRAALAPGAVLEIEGLALMLCDVRPFALPPFPSGCAAWPAFPFGQADPLGLVGESPACWALRQRVAFVAPRAAHVLVRGPSGTGKEAVAQAIHALSPRSRRPLLSRNAATIPEGLVDAELFGNLRNYPNPGMAERPGMVGEADGSSLFLDEFGELPPAVQAHLLRLLDSGEYSRLGESKPRRSDLRLVGATNRPDEALKADVLARFRLRVDTPGLEQRRGDVPLLARHLLSRIARTDRAMARRWFPDGDPAAMPRLDPALVTALVRRPYGTHVRELEALLWRAMETSTGDTLQPWPELLAELAAPRAVGSSPPAVSPPAGPPPAGPPPRDPASIPVEELQAALDRNQGRMTDTARELGLSSRFVLIRLVRRLGLVVERPG